jgi:hypothetical protein
VVSVLVFVVFPFIERGADDSVLVERGAGVHMDLQPGGWDLVANSVLVGVVRGRVRVTGAQDQTAATESATPAA